LLLGKRRTGRRARLARLARRAKRARRTTSGRLSQGRHRLGGLRVACGDGEPVVLFLFGFPMFPVFPLLLFR